MKQKIFFRADASVNIGYGHFVRSLALADMLKDDFDCTFFTQTPTDFQKEEVKRVCKLVSLPNDNSKLEMFLDFLQGDEIIVLDNYFFTTKYQIEIKARGCKLVCIDDMHDKHYIADVVINQATGMLRKNFDVESYTEVLTGQNWFLLRRDFLKEFERNEKAEDVFVCLGGTDSQNITPKAIECALEINQNLVVRAVLGDGYPYWEEIKQKFADNKRVVLHKALSAKQIIDLMLFCRIGLVSASGLLWETQAVRLPVLYGYYAENQTDICHNNPILHDSICIGNFIEIEDDRLTKILVELYNKEFELKESVVQNIPFNYRKVFLSRVTCRRALLEDCEIYYKWANDPIVREMSFNKESIPFESHANWFAKKVASEDSVLYVFFYDGSPIGQVRFDIEDGVSEVDISLDYNYRGIKLGVEILQYGIFKFMLEKPSVRMCSRVLVKNIPSRRIFESSGFTIISETKEVVNYELYYSV